MKIWGLGLVRVTAKIYRKYHNKTDCNLAVVLLRFLYYRIFYRVNIVAHPKVRITGVRNISILGDLEIGVSPFGIFHPDDVTVLNIAGKLTINGSYSIGRGCRFDIGKDAVVTIGKEGHITGFTDFIISNKLSIGDYCAISWNCQFLDDDRQKIFYENKKDKDNLITIGNHVWIGSGAQIYKGTVIADGCVVASNAVVRGVFDKAGCIIGGNPARVIKENVSWE